VEDGEGVEDEEGLRGGVRVEEGGRRGAGLELGTEVVRENGQYRDMAKGDRKESEVGEKRRRRTRRPREEQGCPPSYIPSNLTSTKAS
jgi:hypothetical protein